MIQINNEIINQLSKFSDINYTQLFLHPNKKLFIFFEIFRTKGRGYLCYKETFWIKNVPANIMVLDVLLSIRNKIDPTLSFRRSCREGICGSCAMNINGKNQLACLTTIGSLFIKQSENNSIKTSTFNIIDNTQLQPLLPLFLENNGYHIDKHKVTIFPLPNLINIRDLVPDLNGFFNQYKQIKPWLNNNNKIGITSYKQTQENRKILDGLYECILCACCSTTCPSYWWNSQDYLGPAILLQAYRWLVDSRDQDYLNRINNLKDSNSVYKCHQILNCTKVCPKNLKPGSVIKVLQERIFKRIYTKK